MFCPRCGQEVPEGSMFCPNCGLKLSSVSAEPVDASEPDASPVEIPAPISITPIEVNADGSLAHEKSGEPTAAIPAAASGFVSGVAPTPAAPTSSEAAPRPIDYTQPAPMPAGYAQQQGAGYTQAPPAPSAYVQTQPGYASTQTVYTGTPSKSNTGLVIGIIAAAAVVIAAFIFFVLPKFTTSTTTGSTLTTTQNTTTNNNGTTTNHPLTTQNNSTGDKGTTTNHPLTNNNDSTTTTTTTPTDASAAGTYYAIWQYDGQTWVYTFILNPDGTGTFKLYLAESNDVTQEEVDNDNYYESIVWTQSGSEVTVDNPDSDTDTLPDAPNTYTLSTSGDKRVLTPEGTEYKYPSETLYEDWNTAYTNMDD